MRMLFYIVFVILGLLLIWVGISIWTERGVKEPAYKVEGMADGYEIRLYEPFLIAEVQIPSGTKDALETGFRMLFAYISGENKGKRKIAMTAPVLEKTAVSEQIAMTKPVLRREEQGGTRVAFVLPADYTLEGAPKPQNRDIRIRSIPVRRMAVVRFAGYATATEVDRVRKRLLSHLVRDGLQPVGDFLIAYYNPPWTPPFLRRNEVMVELR